MDLDRFEDSLRFRRESSFSENECLLRRISELSIELSFRLIFVKCNTIVEGKFENK